MEVLETIFSATLKFTKIKLRAASPFITLMRCKAVSAMEVLDNVVLIEKRIALWKCRCFRM
jgi:hypothetical protein